MTRRTYTDISLATLKQMENEPSTIKVDVREDWEFEEFNEGGINIPLATIRDQRRLLDPFQRIIVLCSNGVRSKVAAMDYCRVPEWADKEIYHLKGGILEVE